VASHVVLPSALQQLGGTVQKRDEPQGCFVVYVLSPSRFFSLEVKYEIPKVTVVSASTSAVERLFARLGIS
jgi:hypothetical protein